VKDVFLLHLALSDIDGGQFLYTQRIKRADPGFAGADLEQRRIWNGNCEVRWRGETQRLQAIADRFTLRFSLQALKPPVVNGQSGISRTSANMGWASHYISLTRLATSGALTLDDKEYRVEGISWMDHEFFSHLLDPGQSGWDWFCLQLEDSSELMLYRLRRKDGTPDPYSAGTYVDPRGRPLHLTVRDFSLEPSKTPNETWTSAKTHATYPMRWKILVRSPGLALAVTTLLENQELISENPFAPNYWEGAVRVEGHDSSSALRGVGYLEMTGYDHPLEPPDSGED
jgi:predicted secreted hydrolase